MRWNFIRIAAGKTGRAIHGRVRCGTANGRDATCSRRRRLPPQACYLPSRCKAAAPAADAVTPALIEAAKKRGQGVVLLGARAFDRRAAGARPSRRNIPASPCGSSARAPSGSSSASRRSRRSRINAVDVANSHRPRALSRLEEERLARALHDRGHRQAFSGRPGRSRRHARDRVRLAGGDRLQHRPWSSARMRRRATPTCSIRNGRARWSRRIPATAARS